MTHRRSKLSLRRFDAICPDGKRRKFCLGRMTEESARGIKAKVKQLLSDRASGQPHSQELARWIIEVSGPLRRRLERYGVIIADSRLMATLGEFLDLFFSSLSVKY